MTQSLIIFAIILIFKGVASYIAKQKEAEAQQAKDRELPTRKSQRGVKPLVTAAVAFRPPVALPRAAPVVYAAQPEPTRLDFLHLSPLTRATPSDHKRPTQLPKSTPSAPKPHTPSRRLKLREGIIALEVLGPPVSMRS